MKKIPNRKNYFILSLKIILIILTVIFPVLMVMLAGAGLIYNGDAYGSRIVRMGALLIVSGLLMTAGSVLVCFKKNISALISGTLGFTLCMLMLRSVVNHANSAGWSDGYTMEPVAGMYLARILPSAAPFVLTVVIGLIQFFSYEAAAARRERKRLKEENENRPAPPIL